ncbi:hypothetical protein COPEUT_03016 [Coprococcus eutactus ATCC 27759]|nr:hypothetical protein COPEUT_03016 [Coprococcus eutactus ATCC 27759]
MSACDISETHSAFLYIIEPLAVNVKFIYNFLHFIYTSSSIYHRGVLSLVCPLVVYLVGR